MRYFVLSGLLCCLLASCSYAKKQSWVTDQTRGYQKAVLTPSVQLPKSLTHSVIGSTTEALPNNVTASPLPAVPLPPGSLAEQLTTLPKKSAG